MQKTKIPLQKRFLAIALIVNAKESLSSHQLARRYAPELGPWLQQIRAAMAANQGPLLRGIVEADETYVGGKPRKRNKRRSRKPAKRGRGTGKTAVIGAVERGGKVKAMVVGPESPVSDLTGRGILRFIQDSVDPVLISDEYRAYEAVSPLMPQAKKATQIEGFRGLLKRAWYGQHHHYAKLFKDGLFGSPLYVAEAACTTIGRMWMRSGRL